VNGSGRQALGHKAGVAERETQAGVTNQAQLRTQPGASRQRLA